MSETTPRPALGRDEYDKAAAVIRAGNVANFPELGRTAATLAELDMIHNSVITSEIGTRFLSFDHTPQTQVNDITLPAAPSAGDNALPLSDPQFVARVSPAGTSATAVSDANLPPEGEGIAEAAAAARGENVPPGTPVSEANGQAGENANAGASATTDPAELAKLSRAELNEHAASVGVEDPHLLPNKDAVIEAVTQQSGAGA
jgi:hypothetical protein